MYAGQILPAFPDEDIRPEVDDFGDDFGRPELPVDFEQLVRAIF